MSTKDDSVSIVLKREAIFAVRDVVREKVEHLDQLVGDSLHVDDLVDVEVLGHGTEMAYGKKPYATSILSSAYDEQGFISYKVFALA